MKASVQPQTSSQNETYTYIAIPIEALQQYSEQGVQSLTVAQNIILKALPENITQQIQPITENTISSAISRSNESINTSHVLNSFNTLASKATDKRNVILEGCTRPTVIEQTKSNQHSPNIIRKSVILKSDKNRASNRTEVHYLKVKSVQNNSGIGKSKDGDAGSFKCNLCGQVLDKVMSYRKHMEMHRNTKKFKCEQCSASYNVEDNLKIHLAMHSKSQPTCPICDRKFQRLASLKAHIIIHEVEETFTCVDCLAEYDKEEEFNKHIESHEKGNGKSEKLPLMCSICSHVFDDANRYKEHVSYHIKIKKLIMNGRKQKRRVNTNREYSHKCNVCKKSFSKYCLLERHMRIHSGEKPFACHLCKRAFTQKGTLQIHLARHSGIKPFHCTLCPAKFCQKGNLRVHVQKTHVVPGPGEKIYKCTMCTCIFKRVSSLNAHITRAHAGDKRVDDITDILEQLKELEKQLVPRNVEQNPETEIEIETETDSIVKTEEPIPIIPSDDKGVTVKYVKLVDSSVEGTLRRYLVKSRKVGEHQWYICTFCSKEFKKPSDLIRHFRVHTREKPFQCKQCGQAFSLKSTLATHISTHIGKRQYQCIVCLKMFTSIRTLNTHLRRHDKSSAKRAQHYMCSTCNKVFNSISKAKIHMEMHKTGQALHNKGTEIEVVMRQPMVETANGLFPIAPPKSKGYTSEVDSDKLRPHKCSYCNAGFTKAVHLKRHILIHSGERERKFKCETCSKSFYSSYALKEHLKFHSGERNYNCKSCGKKFVTNAILKRHQTIHSSFRPYVCPYCRKRFKTVMLCRKHINIHKRDLDLEIHALKETGELDTLQITNGTAAVTDLNDPMADEPFTDFVQDDECNLEDVVVENVDDSREIVRKSGLNESPTVSSKTKLSHLKLLQDKNSSSSKILFTDSDSGIIISTPVSNQDTNNELHNSLNQQLYESHSPTTNAPEYVDKSTNLSLISDSANDLGNVEDAISTLTQENLIDSNDIGHSMVYINCDDLQTFTTASLYNACLAQLKNNDPLLLSGINEIQDPNLLFATDPTLNQLTDTQLQLTDTQLDSQNLETLIPTFTFSTNLSINNLSLSTNALNTAYPNIILSNIEDGSDINQLSAFPNVNEVNKKTYNSVTPSTGTDGQKLPIEPVGSDLTNDSVTDINQENAILSHLLYNNNQLDISLNVPSDPKIGFETTDFVNPPVDSMAPLTNTLTKIDILCTHCKNAFKNMEGFKNHSCDIKNNSRNSKSKKKRKLPKQSNKNSSSGSDNSWSPPSTLETNSIIEPNHENVVSEPLTIPDNSPSDPENKCGDCDKIFSTKNALSRHMVTHTKKAPKICTYCCKVFKKRSDLERHIRTHTGEKPFACDKCEKSFSLKSTLESHYRTHNPGGNKDFSCAVCSSYFSSKSSLRVHMLMHTGVKPYQCTLCPEKFRTSGHRKSHMANHFKKTETRKNVQSKTAKVNNLLASVIIDSPNSEQNRTENVSLLNNTEQSLGIKESSQLVIQESEKDILYSNQTIQLDPMILQQLQLNNVLLQNDDELPSFIQVDINNEGQITNVKPITSSAINNINDVNNTLYETTNSDSTKSSNTITRNFECDVCHKKYSTKSVLTKHKKIHAVKNSFNCTKCDTRLSSEEELENHLKLHSGYRPFCCQLCANTFSQEKNLKTHMKRIHSTTS